MPYSTPVSYTHLGVIEIAPLAYMRGRTLNDAFVILDEAQNTTPEPVSYTHLDVYKRQVQCTTYEEFMALLDEAEAELAVGPDADGR